MSKKFFTSDFHLGMVDILKYENRPFKSIEKMNAALVRSCMERASEDDFIYHIGDLYSFGLDRGSQGMKTKPMDIIQQIPATFLNIRGNHDMNNRVKSVADSMRIILSKKYPNVSISHYPSYDARCRNNCGSNEIHLCGHVHGKWRHCLDLTRNVMNINCGVDAWNYKIISEDELISYLNALFRMKPDLLFKCKTFPNGKVGFYGNNDLIQMRKGSPSTGTTDVPSNPDTSAGI